MFFILEVKWRLSFMIESFDILNAKLQVCLTITLFNSIELDGSRNVLNDKRLPHLIYCLMQAYFISHNK